MRIKSREESAEQRHPHTFENLVSTFLTYDRIKTKNIIKKKKRKVKKTKKEKEERKKETSYLLQRNEAPFKETFISTQLTPLKPPTHFPLISASSPNSPSTKESF